jgi:hypothetical protein
MLFCRWCGNTLQDDVDDCPFCNNQSSETSEHDTLPPSEPPKTEPVQTSNNPPIQEPIIKQQNNRNGIPTDDGLHIVHNGRLIDLNLSQDGQHYLAEGEWYKIGQSQYSQPVNQPEPQPVYQPAPQPVYQPAPQPVYQPAPQYIVEEPAEKKGRSVGSIIWLVFLLLLIGAKIAIRS